MVSAFKVYSINTKDRQDTIFEVWGGSTKHPDVRRSLASDKEDNKFYPSQLITSPEYEVFQWVCQCISELSFGTYDLMTDWLEMNSEFKKSLIY